jgi:YesN/AraC family two-component response regulator
MAKQKILVCDDSEGVRESLKLILEEDYKLIFACDGCEALNLIKSASPDLVLMDIKMPKLNGIETLKEIKQIKPKTKILFVTGYQYTDVAQDAIKLGALDYIIKPFSEKDLKTAVKSILKGKR